MNSRKDTTRKLNIETLAKREVFAANVFASMALPVEKIETTSLVGRFETNTEASNQDKVQQKNHQINHDIRVRFNERGLNEDLRSKANSLRNKLATSELDSFKESGKDLSVNGRIKGISNSSISGLNSGLGNGLNNNRNPLNNLSGRTTMGTGRVSATSSVFKEAGKMLFSTVMTDKANRTASELGEDTCTDEAVNFTVTSSLAVADVASTALWWSAPEPLVTKLIGVLKAAGAASSLVSAWGAYNELEECIQQENDKTPDPRDRDTDSGRFAFSSNTVNGRAERMKKVKEIHSNSHGYGTAGPNPMAGEKSSGGPLYTTGNHDDGNNHVKEKTQSTGRIKDILVKAGGGATDPHDNTFATNVDSVLSRWGR